VPTERSKDKLKGGKGVKLNEPRTHVGVLIGFLILAAGYDGFLALSAFWNNQMELTAVFVKVPEGYVAFVEELPGANTQGATLEEARENLREALALVIQANRQLAEESLRGEAVTREPLVIPA